MFGIQKTPIYGTYGEFAVGSDKNQVRAKFLLTKMKPGEGGWESMLASQMVPWREVFNIEELTFDELLQRDLDDSRVAHDLIPYLTGESGDFAKFFPPILAVLVPRKKNRSGIESYYPQSESVGDESLSFGELFDFKKMKFPDETGQEVVSPLGEIRYNQQKSAFIIVDGQHRAMAVLALHRQINDDWSGNNFATFYNHLNITEEQVRSIELPICVVFFPDLHEGNVALKEKGIDLKAVCREVFLVVNKTAKPVSQSRELLLDDKDIAARMMRETLSKLKGRGEDTASLARIYSFAFGDSVSEGQHRKTEVVQGQLEFTTAVALHKMHAAVAFGMPKAFKLDEYDDITDGRKIQNPDRPVSILIGTQLETWAKLSRFSGKYHSPDEIKLAVELLSSVTDKAILPLFDSFRPFAIHNKIVRALRGRLQDPDLRSEPTQRKCYSLLFEGSGVRSVFDEHIKRLKEREESQEENLSDYVRNQLEDAQTVAKALKKHEDRVKEQRAAELFQIHYKALFPTEETEADKVAQVEILRTAKPIFDTISTQAFQLGYLMLVHSITEIMLAQAENDDYSTRIKSIEFITKLYIKGMNAYFSEKSETEHRTVTGLIREPRSKVFDSTKPGLRGLLAESVGELNERQWIFFRYAILEIVHSQYSLTALVELLNDAEYSTQSKTYREILPLILENLHFLRSEYINKAVDSHLNSIDFKREIELLQAELKGEGKTDDEIEDAITAKKRSEEEDIRLRCHEHLRASLGRENSKEAVLNQLISESSAVNNP